MRKNSVDRNKSRKNSVDRIKSRKNSLDRNNSKKSFLKVATSRALGNRYQAASSSGDEQAHGTDSGTIYKQRASAELDSRGLRQRRGCIAALQYKISTMVQKDSSSLVLFWIFVLFVMLVGCCGGVFYLIGVSSFKNNGTLFPTDLENLNLLDYIFAGLLVMTDTGAMMHARSTVGRLMSFVFGLLGFIMLSVILALIVEYIGAWMEKIKMGRTNVVERDHVVILGWSDVCFALVRELDLSTDDGMTIVVLCPLDRKELSHRVRENLPRGSKSKVIVRNGFPGNVTDLVTVGVNHASAIIVPAPPGNADEADNYVLNVVMALKAIGNVPRQDAHIVAELRDVDNEDMVSLLGGFDVVTMVSHDIVGRMMTMAARQPGLASVFESMLGVSRLQV
jgi:hypothetical protein